ncbi:MAG: hypothetical protein K8R59_13075 [Thermoanaerobaculales bacterium]|nr:hypothetical protein [Thermoanaerobaculales bacterium]
MGGVFLIGFMGCGKSAVGVGLAERLNTYFYDVDLTIESREGMSIHKIFLTRGEKGFRELERETFSELAGRGAGVFAGGGGLFMDATNRKVIEGRGGLTVFLDVAWDVLARRLQGTKTRQRPLFRDLPQARTLYETRVGTYRQADITVFLSGQESVEEATDRVMDQIREVACAT